MGAGEGLMNEEEGRWVRSYVCSPGCLIGRLAGCEMVCRSVVVRATPVFILF